MNAAPPLRCLLLLIFSCVFTTASVMADTAALASVVKAMREGKFAQSERTLLSLIEAEPANGLYWFNLGTVQFNLKKFRSSITSFRRVIALEGPLTPAAWLSIAKGHRQLGENGPAREALHSLLATPGGKDLKEAVKAEREKLSDTGLRKGMESFRERDFAQALAYFTDASRATPSADATLMRGLCLWHLGQTSEASEHFRRVLASSDRRDLHEDAQFFLDKITSREGESRFWLFGDFGVGHNSNLFLDGASESPVGRFATQVLLGAGLRMPGTAPWLARLSYLAYWEETPGAVSGRLLSQSLRSPLGFDNGSLAIQVVPVLAYQILETEPYTFKTGSALKVKRRYGSFALSANYDWAQQFSQSIGMSYLNGQTHGFSVGGSLSDSAYEVEAFYSLFIDDIGDLVATDATLPLAGEGHGPSLRGVWYAGGTWEAEVSLSFLSRKYRHFAQPGDLSRADSLYRASARVSREIRSALRGFVTLTLAANRSTLTESSNIDDKNYTQLITLAGVSWDILR